MDDMVILYMKAILAVLKQYLSWRLLSYSFLKLQFTHMISNIHGQWSMCFYKAHPIHCILVLVYCQ